MARLSVICLLVVMATELVRSCPTVDVPDTPITVPEDAIKLTVDDTPSEARTSYKWDVHRGQTISISLKQNSASTGYQWIRAEPFLSYHQPPTNTNSIPQTANPIDFVGCLPRPSTTKLIGAMGTEEWVFHVKSNAALHSTTTIRLMYARPWEATTTTVSDIPITELILTVEGGSGRSSSPPQTPTNGV